MEPEVRREYGPPSGTGLHNRTEQGRAPSRSPRLGSFITIAMAVLMLFGAVSRIGKMPESTALFSIDRQTENRIRQEEERLRTVITIGAAPVPAADLRPRAGVIPIESDFPPPAREEVDPEMARGHFDPDRRSPVSLAVPEGFWRHDGGYDLPVDTLTTSVRPPVMDSSPSLDSGHSIGQANPAKSYVVANGDTWVKIAMRTFGDPKRWEEIKQANPAAAAGLKVGMRLVVP